MADLCCPWCGLTKPESEFYTRVHHRGRGRGKRAETRCRDCHRWRLREAYRPTKERLSALKLATGCMDCGYNAHPEALEYDHRPGEVKVAPVSRLMVTAPWSVIEAEIAKCDLVCANCHRVRTANRQQYKSGPQPPVADNGGQLMLGDESVPVALVAPTGT